MRDWALLGTVLALLSLATFGGQWLKRQTTLGLDTKAVDSFNSRIQAWWFFSVVLGISFFYPILTVVLFGMLSFWALREYITLTPTDHGGPSGTLLGIFLFHTHAIRTGWVQYVLALQRANPRVCVFVYRCQGGNLR